MTTIAQLGIPQVEMEIPAPFGWPGGKRLLSKRIISLIPPHKTYVEPFAGAASVFWAKEPSGIEVLNDLDPDLMRFYRNIGSIDHCDINQLTQNLDNIRAREGGLEACEFLTDVMCSFGTLRSAGGASKERCQRGAPRFHRYLPQYQARLRKVKLHNVDWEKVTRQYDAPDTFFYFDPPYHGYSYQLYLIDTDQLDRLAQVLLTLKGKWLLSYDDHEDVKKAFKSFNFIPVTNRYALRKESNTKLHTELLIANYPIKLEMKQEAVKVKISGTCIPDESCSVKVKATETTEKVSGIPDLPVTIDAVIRELEEKRKPKGTPKTFALGTNQLTRYEFEYRVVEADTITASHNEVTFELNPAYPPELQPRLRARAANRTQVQQMAANLDPDALLSEFHSIDRGAPILGKDLVVESGNGRVMAIKYAIAEFPDVYSRYREALKTKAPQYGLSLKEVEKAKFPVLIRVRLTEIDRRTFVEEANASTVLTPSAIEVARSDALKLTPTMVGFLEVTEAETIEDALRSPRNREFVSMFLAKLPATDRGQISDAKGQLNQDGNRRIVMALFVATFPGDTGLRLAEKYFESTDVNARNVFNGILGSLGGLIEAETLARSEERDPELAIGEDIANAVVIFSDIKRTPGMTVSKYLAQIPMFEKQLTEFQERLLKVIDENSRSGKKIASLFRGYAEVVIKSPHLKQVVLIPDGRITKEQALEQAIKMMEQPTLMMEQPRWSSGVKKTKADIDSLYRRLTAMREKVAQAKKNLEVPLNICAGQREMFPEKGVKMKQGSPDQLYIDYTNDLLIDHLLLAEDHLLKLAEKPTEQCATCLYWHGRKLSAYTNLECPKFEGADVSLCYDIATFVSKLNDRLDEAYNNKEEALALAKEARDLRYRVAGEDNQPNLEEAEMTHSNPVVKWSKNLDISADMLAVLIRLHSIHKAMDYIESLPTSPDSKTQLFHFWRCCKGIAGLVGQETPNNSMEEQVEMAEKKIDYINSIIGREIYIGHLRPDPQPVFERARELNKKAKAELEEIYRAVTTIWALVNREVLKATLRALDISAKQQTPRTLQQIAQEQNAILQAEKARPKNIIVWRDFIEKHYEPKEAFHSDSFRSKYVDTTLITLGCLKKHKWYPEKLECVPTQTLHRTIVPREPKYIKEAEEWETVGVPSQHRETEVKAEPKAMEN